MVLRAICSGVLCSVFVISSRATESKFFTYTWTPKTRDIGRAPSKDYVTLRALLVLVKPTPYIVINGDSIDYIIRNHYLVSQSFRNAYSLYFKRILELNPELRSDTILRAGRTIQIPSGPIYGGTELSKERVSPHVKDVMFRKLSKKAYELGIATNDKVQKFSTRSLGAYVSPSGIASQPEVVFNKIKVRGLVNAIDLTRHPEATLNQVQVLDLNVTDEPSQTALSSIIQSDPKNLLPGMFPVSNPVSVVCDPNAPCTSCGMNLQIPPGVDLTKARVLIEDTGINAGRIDSDHLIPEKTGDTGLDESPVNHGTFVYSEIAAPSAAGAQDGFGVIPKNNVYVAKAVEDVGGTQYFSMSDIMNGWKLFSSLMNADSTAATTWVVNISAFGEPVPDPDHPPTIPNDGHLLIVAAAGNDDKEDEPALYAFPRLSNGSTPLLITGALAADGSAASYSNWNATYVHLFAPGNCVCGAPGKINGTSQAAPFVSTAAAVLASARPDWNPRYVMWRLLSTADHPPTLQGKAFAGTVNLSRALDPLIVLKEIIPGASPKIHHAVSITYDSNWKAAFQSAGINILNKETLRLYSPIPGSNANETCFTSLQILYPPTSICVSSNSEVTLTESDSSSYNVQASKISDLILPMPGASDATLPDITVRTSR